jgi:hypothetical protein
VRFYTTEQLSKTRALTPEGYLLCKNVPIARIGKQQYARGEVPVPPGPDGTIWIEREPEEVFRQETIDSYAGKPVVDDHPPLGIKVTPDNWRNYTIGIVLNPHRGDGTNFDNDFMYGDLLITHKDAVDELKPDANGNVPDREVSAGYDAEYDETGPGRGRQRDIIGNHVALVDKGRCGPRCAIGDHEMPKFNFKAFRDGIMKRAAIGDADGVGEELKKLPDMLGDIVSDAAEPDTKEEEKDGHHITVNVHGAGTSAAQPGMDRARMRDADPEDEGHASKLDELAERVGAIEEALTLLAHEEGDEDDDQPEPAADRRMRDKKMRDREKRAKAAYDRIMSGDAEDEPDDKKDDPDDKKEEPKDDKKEEPWKVGDPGSEEKGKETGDKKTTTGDSRAAVGDSASLRVAFTEMVSRAEVLCPGLRNPTFDSKQTARLTTETMCQFRRYALAEGWKGEGRDAIEPVLGGDKPVFHDKAMTCDAVKTLFNAASTLKQRTTTETYRPNGGGRVLGAGVQKIPTAADINARNRELYGPKH